MSNSIGLAQPGKQHVDHREIVTKIRKLIAHGLTRVDIGVRLGVEETTIRRWLKECP